MESHNLTLFIFDLVHMYGGGALICMSRLGAVVSSSLTVIDNEEASSHLIISTN